MKQYTKYKDSGLPWLGKVPEHWNVKKLRYLLRKKITDGPHETPEFIDEGIPFLSVDSIQDGKIDFEGCRFISKEAHELYKKKCIVEKNDILMGKAASIGKIAKVNVDFEFSVWSPLAIIKSNEKLVDTSYLEYSLKSPETQYQIEILCTSNTQKNISMDDIPRIILTLPEVYEQKFIVQYLDKQTQKLDTLIEKRKRMVDLLDEERSAIINHAVTKGINPKAKMKESGVEWIGEIPEHWEVRKISRSFNTLGSGTTPESGNDLYYINGTINWVLTGDLNNGCLFETSKKVTQRAFEDYSSLKIFPKGTLLIAMYGATIGKISLLMSEACLNQACCALSDSKLFTQEFIFNWFLSNKENIVTLGYGGGQPNISQEIIKSLKVPCPPIQEQQQIVKHIETETSKIDRTLAKIEKEIALLQEYKTALISEAVTGKIDVRGEIENV